MRRREVLGLVGGAAAGWPLGVRAQQTTMPVMGLVGSATAGQWAPFVSAFMQGLSETGFVEGRNVAIEYRWAEGQFNRLPALAADLVQREVAVIAALTTPAAVAAKAAIQRLPLSSLR
jgi:putative ABC transport system substrate-binding protein